MVLRSSLRAGIICQLSLLVGGVRGKLLCFGSVTFHSRGIGSSTLALCAENGVHR